jgi:hypothetical protein
MLQSVELLVCGWSGGGNCPIYCGRGEVFGCVLMIPWLGIIF